MAIQRCTSWQLRTKKIHFGKLPQLMGIVNVTPDSFSDGGHYFSPQLAIDHALRLEDAGASILDIGGESTRPYSQSVAADEELRRIVPVIEGLVDRVQAALSIDTSKACVAQAAIDLGAEIINDVTGLEGDPNMLDLAHKSGAAVCVMHMQGTPSTMQDNPVYGDVVTEVIDYLRNRHSSLCQAGIAPDRICLDPGIGFGKSHDHNLQLLSACMRFHQLGRPILIGHSRKGFIGKLIGDKHRDRTDGSIGISIAVALAGMQIIRIHDVQATRDALVCFEAIAADHDFAGQD